MSGFFAPDGKLNKIIKIFGCLIITNIFMIVFSLPVVTIGPAIVAGCRVTRNILNGDDSNLLHAFWDSFRESLKQAIIIGIVNMLVIACLIYNYGILQTIMPEEVFPYAAFILLLLLFEVMSVCTYIYFLISRYENRMKDHIRNAIKLFSGYFLRSLGMAIIGAVPLFLFFCFPGVFLNTLFIWIGFGFAMILYIDNMIMQIIFKNIESTL